MCRLLIGILRLLVNRNIQLVSEKTVLCVNLLGFLVISTTAVAIRKRGFEYIDSDILNAILTSMLVSFSEVLSLVCFLSLQQSKIFGRLKGIHYSYLNEVLETHNSIQKEMYLFYGHLWSEESAERAAFSIRKSLTYGTIRHAT